MTEQWRYVERDVLQWHIMKIPQSWPHVNKRMFAKIFFPWAINVIFIVLIIFSLEKNNVFTEPC